MDPRKYEERVTNTFETWSWRRMLKIKRTDRITNDEVYQRAKEKRLILKMLQNGRHSWIGHTVTHNEFVVNILEGTISGKKGSEKTSTTMLKASHQKHSDGKNDLQQFQMESSQPIKRLKNKKKIYVIYFQS